MKLRYNQRTRTLHIAAGLNHGMIFIGYVRSIKGECGDVRSHTLPNGSSVNEYLRRPSSTFSCTNDIEITLPTKDVEVSDVN